ncbi:putative reverse transcriptase domain-containing protein [Tanacetum coccineum]
MLLTLRRQWDNSQRKCCFECGAPRHFKRDCPKLKNKDKEMGMHKDGFMQFGKQKEGNAPGNPSKGRHGTFLLNNHYASILFDTGADRSFISTAFSSLINIAPTSLENCYDVELADGKLVEIDTIIRGCTLNFLGHPFNIDLMPVELGSFDVIIGMDWLRRCHAVIVCDEKLVQIPYGSETLTFCGNESSNGRESRLTVISCSKAQEYMAKGCQVFLAQISAKKEETSPEWTDRGLPIAEIFQSISRGLAGPSSSYDQRNPNRLNFMIRTLARAPIEAPSENEGNIQNNTRNFRQGKIFFFFFPPKSGLVPRLGDPGLNCQKEDGRSDVASPTRELNKLTVKKSLSTPEDRRFVYHFKDPVFYSR